MVPPKASQKCQSCSSILIFSLNNMLTFICGKNTVSYRPLFFIKFYLCYTYLSNTYLSLQQKPWNILITRHVFCVAESNVVTSTFVLDKEYSFKTHQPEVTWTWKCCWPAEGVTFIFHECSPVWVCFKYEVLDDSVWLGLIGVVLRGGWGTAKLLALKFLKQCLNEWS